MGSVVDPLEGSRRLPGQWVAWIAAAALIRVLYAALVTDFVLVDDAYITLRYAKNAAATGALVYSQGEAVFGVTSPLWGFVTWGLMELVGQRGIEVAVVLLGIALSSAMALRIAQRLPDSCRGITLGLLLFAPVFVDNQMLGMETPLVAFLAVFAMDAALRGRLTSASFWAGLLMVARPEGVLFAPALLYAASTAHGGVREALRGLVRPVNALLLLAPGLAWIAFALQRYGTVLPQSMVAKSGWNSAHYDALGTAAHLWFSVARLTFVPFIDYLPAVMGHAITAALVVAIGWILWANVTHGTPMSRAWMGLYVVYMTFYLLGKGATEASWYAVPSSLALLLAAGPAIPRALASGRRAQRLAVPSAAALVVASTVFVQMRAPLLQSYVDGYGACADALEALERPHEERVLIGEIGVFGFRTEHALIDVGALVSPEVLPIKNRGVSLVRMAQDTEATWLVVSDIALEKNAYPSVGDVWSSEAEREWLESSILIAHCRDKRLLRLPPRAGSGRSDSPPATTKP